MCNNLLDLSASKSYSRAGLKGNLDGLLFQRKLEKGVFKSRKHKSNFACWNNVKSNQLCAQCPTNEEVFIPDEILKPMCLQSENAITF